MNGQLHALAVLPPRKVPPVCDGYEVKWTPQPVLALWSIEKCLATAGNRAAVQPVASRYTD
jgi:hypothetical protein